MIRAYSAALKVRRKPGRKPDPRTTTVATWRREGMRWSEVYKRVGYNELEGWERTCAKDSLRRNVTAFMKRNGVIPPHAIHSRSRTRRRN